MLEGLLAAILWCGIPDINLFPIDVGIHGLYEDLKNTIKIEDAIEESCDIYVKDYTDCNPEWKWGNSNGILNYHELVGFSLEVLQRDVFLHSLRKIEKNEPIPNSDYTLRLYFRENICVRVEYCRPWDKQFLTCYGHGESTSFHVYSECFGDKKYEVPIDFNITYIGFINVVFLKKGPQMYITARFCGEKLPYVSSSYCRCKEY